MSDEAVWISIPCGGHSQLGDGPIVKWDNEEQLALALEYDRLMLSGDVDGACAKLNELAELRGDPDRYEVST